jgi:hypothetical protein
VGNFAAKPAFEAALRLEEIARREDFEHIPSALETLEHEIHRLQSALKQWVNNPDQTDVAGQSLAPPPTTAAASNARVDSSYS